LLVAVSGSELIETASRASITFLATSTGSSTLSPSKYARKKGAPLGDAINLTHITAD